MPASSLAPALPLNGSSVALRDCPLKSTSRLAKSSPPKSVSPAVALAAKVVVHAAHLKAHVERRARVLDTLDRGIGIASRLCEGRQGLVGVPMSSLAERMALVPVMVLASSPKKA